MAFPHYLLTPLKTSLLDLHNSITINIVIFNTMFIKTLQATTTLVNSMIQVFSYRTLPFLFSAKFFQSPP